MAVLLHEVWLDLDEETDERLPCLLLAGPAGDGSRALLNGAQLVHTFHAGSHFEAMTLYRQFLGWEPYATNHPEDHEPYPDGWLQAQLSRPD